MDYSLRDCERFHSLHSEQSFLRVSMSESIPGWVRQHEESITSLFEGKQLGLVNVSVWRCTYDAVSCYLFTTRNDWDGAPAHYYNSRDYILQYPMQSTAFIGDCSTLWIRRTGSLNSFDYSEMKYLPLIYFLTVAWIYHLILIMPLFLMVTESLNAP